MATRFKFIHTADIHLGSILHTSRKTDNRELSSIFSNAVYHSFTMICNIAIENKVDFIVISGDLYDKESRSVRAAKFFIDQCERLKENNIQVYVIHGNHDPYKEKNEILSLPENVHIFGSETSEYFDVINNKGEVVSRVIGQSYRSSSESRKIQASFIDIKNGVYNIGLLHTQLESNNHNYVPCSLNELKSNEHINYWALGHIHKTEILNEKKPVIAYSGIPQGRDFGEEGIGGVFLVEVDEGLEANISFIQTSKVIWKKIYSEIDENKDDIPKNLSDLEQFLINKVNVFLKENKENREILNFNANEVVEPQGYIIQWVLTGRGEVHKLLADREEEVINVLIESLNNEFLYKTPFIWTDSIVIRTAPNIDNLELIKKQNSIYKEIEEFTKQCIENSELKKQVIDNFGGIWEYSSDSEDSDVQKFLLNDEILEEILHTAKQLAIEKLLDGSMNQ